MKKILSLVLVATFILVLSACKPKTKAKVLVVGYDDFSEKFSPFFATTAYDRDVADMTGVSLLTTDRDGQIIYKSINGEEKTLLDGTKYTYKGISDIDVDIDEEANETTYTIKIRDDVKFSDGHVLDADDIIFSYYVLIDPYYTGSSTLGSIKIKGIKNYQQNSTIADQIDALAKEVLGAVGLTKTDVEDLDPEELDERGISTDNKAFVASKIEEVNTYVKNEMEALLEAEYDWVKADVVAENSPYGPAGYWITLTGEAYDEAIHTFADVSVAATFLNLYTIDLEAVAYDEEDKELTKEAIVELILNQYLDAGYSYSRLEAKYGSSILSPKVYNKAFEFAKKKMEDDENTGEDVPNVVGITKVSSTEVKVVTEGFDAAAIYQIGGITVAPMHYYGDETKYDYANNKFGFDMRTEKGLDIVNSKTAKPMGAGAYKFIEYKENVVRFEANEHYYKGKPKIKYINFQEVSEANKITGIAIGDLDISNPSGSRQKFLELAEYKDTIYVSSIANLGYGYIGINALNVQVGNTDATIGTDASKALRKAFATVLASFRYSAVPSYYGDAAEVIEYPISSTSWAAPRPNDPGYKYAYSTAPGEDGEVNIYTDANGNPVNPATLTNKERSIAAKEAARLWLKKAGYNLSERPEQKKYVQYGGAWYTATAPEGGKTAFEIIVPGGGTGDHPAMAIINSFKGVMAELGILININDPANANTLWNALDTGGQEMWAAAWGASIDPDMYQIYHSGNTILNGALNSTGSNHYYIKDQDLDNLIMSARATDDQSERKADYKEALDILLDWAVEVPTYQRQNIIAISSERVNIDTLTPQITTYWVWMNDIEKLELK